MIVQLTDYAVGVLATNPSPALDIFKIGSAFNYVPLPTDQDIHGSTLFQGQISQPLVLNANVVKYTITMDTSIGDFDWGEAGLFYHGQLFALIVGQTPQAKRKVGAASGNQARLDAFLTMVGTNYDMVVDQADSSNQFMMASLSTIDQLPPSGQTTPNTYIISAAASNQSSFLAYTDRQGLWNFDAYQFSTGSTATVTAADLLSVTIALTDYVDAMNPTYFGQVALEFATGKLYSICRYVKSAVKSGSTVTLGFQTPLAVIPKVGDKIQTFTRLENTLSGGIPIATTNTLGGIKIGAGLLVEPDGTTSVDASALGAVKSVNSKLPNAAGNVALAAADIPGFATVATTGRYSDLVGAPGPYTLPMAGLSVLGGVKMPSNGNIKIDALGVIDIGFPVVKTVNGVGPDANGNVAVTTTDIGLINPAAVPNAADLNTLNTTGLFTVTLANSSTLTNAPASGEAATLEIVPLVNTASGDMVQRWTTQTSLWWRARYSGTWGSWKQVSTLALATTSTVGVVKIGSGLAVDGAGLLSVDNTKLPIASAAQLGVIKVGSGLAVTGAGVLSADFSQIPVATASAPGIVKPGAGLSVAGDGTLAINSATLPIASAATLGAIKVGAGLSIGGDGTLSIGAAFDKLDRVNGIATGIFLKGNPLGSVTSVISGNVSTANFQTVTVTGTGAVTWSLTGWPASGNYAEMEFQITNGGVAASHTFPAQVKWIKPDGTMTNDFLVYMTAKRGTTNFQTAGIDFCIFWSSDGGTTIYARVL